jgi:antitoxin component of RelBE/YafQ-DinJ toxin-antitoxin module
MSTATTRKTVLNVKVDTDVRDVAREVASAIGIPLSTVVNAYLKDFIRNRHVTLSADPQYNPRIVKELHQLSAEMKKGKNVSPAFSSIDDAAKWLNA